MSRNMMLQWFLSALLAISLAACSSSEDQINELLQSASGSLQKKRVITLSEKTIEGLRRVDAIVVIRSQDLDVILPIIIENLNEDKNLKDKKIQLKNLTMNLLDQVLTINTDLLTTVNDIEIDSSVQFSAFVGAFANGLALNLRADGIHVNNVKSQSVITADIIKVIASSLQSLLPIINVALDEQVNKHPDRAIIASFNQPNLINQQLQDLSTSNLVVDKRELKVGMVASATAVVIKKDGILAAVQLDFVDPTTVTTTTPGFPPDDELVVISEPNVLKRIVHYQSRVIELIIEGMGDSVDTVVSFHKTGFVITKEALARLINYAFSTGDISGTYKLQQDPQTSTSDFTFSSVTPNIDCGQFSNECKYKDRCAGDQCKQVVRQIPQLDRACAANCCATNPPCCGDGATGFGTNLCTVTGQKSCNEICKTVKDVLGDIASQECDAFRAYDSTLGGHLCAIANNLEKAACDFISVNLTLTCTAMQNVEAYYSANPMGQFTASLRTGETLQVATNGKLDSDFSKLETHIDIDGQANADAKLQYKIKSYSDPIMSGPNLFNQPCLIDWDETKTLDATLRHFSGDISFSTTWSQKSDKTVVITFMQADAAQPIYAYVDLSSSPLDVLFRYQPTTYLKCPLMMIGSGTVLAVATATLTRNNIGLLFPFLVGKNIPVIINGLAFEMNMEPQKLCRSGDSNCNTPILVLKPTFEANVVKYLSD